MTENGQNGIFVEKNDENIVLNIRKPAKIEFKATKGNKKALIVLMRSLKNPENDKNCCTFRFISESLELHNRQDSNNFWRIFQESGYDLPSFLQRKQKLRAAFPLIEKQVLDAPLLDIKEHHREFCRKHQQYKMSYSTFLKNYNSIDAAKFRKQIKNMLLKDKISLDSKKLISEVLEETGSNSLKRKEIVELFPEPEQDVKEESLRAAFLLDINDFWKYILTMLMVAFGMNYSTLSILFGVAKSTVNNYFHKLSFIKEIILRSIIRWSGEISVDEKWVKINSKWHYVLSIVDNKTGFPLYFNLVSSLTSDTWKLFFQRFYHLYGIPNLIVSDGSQSLAKARKLVFPNVSYQLCKFHKYKNLLRRIYQMPDGKIKDRCFRLAKGIFCNKTYFGRKRAAIKLISLNVHEVSSYVEHNIIKNWKGLTKNMTSNASERWNRKIEKVISKRYGLKSPKFVNQLLSALWLKEALKNKQHFEKCFLDDIDLNRLCQENLKVCNLMNTIRRNLLKEVA